MKITDLTVKTTETSKTYTIRVTSDEQHTFNIAHPVYTGNLNSKGRPNTSRVYKMLHEHTVTRQEVELVEVTKEEAQVIQQYAMENGLIFNCEDHRDSTGVVVVRYTGNGIDIEEYTR